MFSIRRIKSHLAALLLSMTAVSGEAAFSNVFFFGDSLSDTGNGYTASGGTFPPSPYQDGRFSDGPLWVEYLASGLGLPAASDAWLNPTLTPASNTPRRKAHGAWPPAERRKRPCIYVGIGVSRA